MDTIQSLRTFCFVAELRSFTAAAARLGLSPAMASKHIMALERRLAARLLNRTSRHVSLTEAGAHYLEQVRPMIDGLDEIEAAIGRSAASPRGVLRVSAPVWMANPTFARVIAAYRARFNEVRLDIDLTGRMVGLIDEGFDLALRATPTPDPGLIARVLTGIPFYLVASPSHLDRSGRPNGLDELSGRDLLAYSLVAPEGRVTWEGAGTRHSIKFNAVLVSGNETLLHFAALEGMGLAFLPKWLVDRDVEDGRLEIVLPEIATINARLYAVYPTRKYLSAKVRTFLDFIAGALTA